LSVEEVDDKILKLICVWHDISYAFHKANAWQFFLEGPRGKGVFREYAQKIELNKDEEEIILSVILHHDIYKEFIFLNKKRNLYYHIIQDADFLEEFNEERIRNAEKMAGNSLYWKFLINIMKPLFFGYVLRNKKKFLNFEQSQLI